MLAPVPIPGIVTAWTLTSRTVLARIFLELAGLFDLAILRGLAARLAFTLFNILSTRNILNK